MTVCPLTVLPFSRALRPLGLAPPRGSGRLRAQSEHRGWRPEPRGGAGERSELRRNLAISHLRKLRQVAALRRLPALARRVLPAAFALVAAVTCAAPGPSLPAFPGAAWPPSQPRCFLGASDPTLRSDAAWTSSGELALAEAGRRGLGLRVRAGLKLDSWDAASSEVVLQGTEGRLGGLVLAGWWFDREGRGADGRCGPGCSPGTSWAVACVAGAEAEAPGILPGAFRGPLPDWLARPRFLRATNEGPELCALGLSGARMDRDEAEVAAREDARARLALALCAEVKDATVDLSGSAAPIRGAWEFPEWKPAPGAAERVATAGRDVVGWTDTKGTGPLASPGVVYALACVQVRGWRCGR